MSPDCTTHDESVQTVERRLIHCGKEIRQSVKNVTGCNRHGVMTCAEAARRFTRGFPFAELLLVECHCETVDRLRGYFCCQPCDGGRIDPSREEHSHRDIGDEMARD